MATPPPSGGFFLSPPASTISNSSSTRSTLPYPRSTPLRPGGTKEGAFIRYVDQRLLHIQRRFAKRTTPSSPHLSDVSRDKADGWGDVRGYASMKEACRDVDEVVGVVWVSGTPGLQIPYLISIALLVGELVRGMPPSSGALFRTLGLLDYGFASLFKGRDLGSGRELAGFEGGRGISGTEKVRVRSLVERTRVAIVEAFKRGECEGEKRNEDMDMDTDTDMDTDMEGDGGLVLDGEDHEDMAKEEDSLDMQIARVYDRTVVELGDSLQTPNIGIITEERS